MLFAFNDKTTPVGTVSTWVCRTRDIQYMQYMGWFIYFKCVSRGVVYVGNKRVSISYLNKETNIVLSTG